MSFGGVGFSTSLGESIAEQLRVSRQDAISRMRGTCIITVLGNEDRDDATDADGDITVGDEQVYPDPTWPADHPHADGKCYLRYPGLAFAQNADSAGTTIVQSRIVVRIPFGVVIRPDAIVEITADADNPQLAGTRLRVASIDNQSQATAQRLICEERQAGA